MSESLSCDSLTALVGRNGSGKSSFLSAIELFYDPAARVTVDDFYSEDVTQDIEIAITFGDLSSDATELFSTYIDNGVLTVGFECFHQEKGKRLTPITECVFKKPSLCLCQERWQRFKHQLPISRDQNYRKLLYPAGDLIVSQCTRCFS